MEPDFPTVMVEQPRLASSAKVRVREMILTDDGFVKIEVENHLGRFSVTLFDATGSIVPDTARWWRSERLKKPHGCCDPPSKE